jgi:hypothetical protein
MKLHFAENMDEVLSIALESPLPQYVEEQVPANMPVTPSSPTQGPVAHQ